jgi:hypothetical protein
MALKYQVEGEDERKKYILDQKMNQREVSVMYDHLFVFIRHDTAEIGGSRRIGVGSLNSMLESQEIPD